MITNLKLTESVLHITDIIASTPEVDIELPENMTFPIQLGAQDSITISVITTP